MATETERLDAIDGEIISIKHDLVGMEHRLVNVVRNAYWALTKTNGWPATRRLEAGAALIRYFLAGRAMVVISVGLGGLLALHASFILTDQNRKLDLQNHLSVVASEIAEAQRNSQFAQLIPPLMDDLRRNNEKIGKTTGVEDGFGRPLTRPSEDVAIRVAVLTQTFQPYKWIDKNVEAGQYMAPAGEGALFRLMQIVRTTYDSAFGSAAIDPTSAKSLGLKMPNLTPERYSPERGLILINLYALQASFDTLTTLNVTFDRAYMPGARLDGLSLQGLTGPELSRNLRMQGAYLADASLNRARLNGVDLSEAVLKGASMGAADLRQVNFVGANLEESKLVAADLSFAKFEMANVKNADFDMANLERVDLSKVLNLREEQIAGACIHDSTILPSYVTRKNTEILMGCCARWPNSFKVVKKDVCKPIER